MVARNEGVKKMSEQILPHKALCRYCKKEFTVTHKNMKYCCQRCKSRARTQREKQYYAKRVDEMEQKNKTAHERSDLSAVALEARKHGMSYGQYVIYMENQNQKG